MGAEQTKFRALNEEIPADGIYDRSAPKVSGEGEIHMLIVALDYKRTQNPLTCSQDGRNMEALARQCGVTDLVSMYDEQCTKEAVLAAIGQVGGRCGEDDYFILYYSGHGTQVNDEDEDEDEGQDEALCLVDGQGQVSRSTLLIDDDLAEILTGAVDEDARILVLTDCCHSGTICDFDKEIWAGRQACSIAGCLDSQTSGDMGKGGIYTHSMLLAIDQLEDAGQEDYSVGMLYNATVENDDKVFNSAQDITIQCPPDFTPHEMAWPLIPDGFNYLAPLTQAAQQAAGGQEVDTQAAVQMAAQNPQLLAQVGIQPSVINAVDTSGLIAALSEDKIDPEKLLKAGYNFYKSGGCEPIFAAFKMMT